MKNLIVAFVTLFITVIITAVLFVIFKERENPKEDVPNEPTTGEVITIDNQHIETVTDDDGNYYLKYFIGGPQRWIYIPLPVETEVEESDSLKFIYTKKENNEKESKRRDTKRNVSWCYH